MSISKTDKVCVLGGLGLIPLVFLAGLDTPSLAIAWMGLTIGVPLLAMMLFPSVWNRHTFETLERGRVGPLGWFVHSTTILFTIVSFVMLVVLALAMVAAVLTLDVVATVLCVVAIVLFVRIAKQLVLESMDTIRAMYGRRRYV